MAYKRRNDKQWNSLLNNDTNSSTESVVHGEGKYRSGNSRVLVFLIVLFALTTVALAAVLAVTILKLDENDKQEVQVVYPTVEGGNQQGQHQNTAKPQQPLPTQAPARTAAPVKTAAPVQTAVPVQTLPKQDEDEVCLTEGCVLAAARVASAMDKTVEPCDDFYKFACGTWLKQNVIPEDKSSFGTFSKLRDDVLVILKIVMEAEGTPQEPESAKKARDYYKACLNTSRIEELGLAYIHEYAESLTGLPALANKPGGKWNESGYNLESLLSNARKGTNSLPLIDIGVGQDDKNPTANMLIIDQPGLGLPSRDYFLKPREDKVLVAYETMIKNMFKALGADEATAANDAKDIVDLEIDIANITVPREERRDPEKLYNKIPVSQLSQNFSGVNWMPFIREIFTVTGETIDDTEPIDVVSPPYFRKLGAVLQKYSGRVITNYVVGHRVLSKVFYLPQIFRDYSLEFDKVLSGTATTSPRWQDCSDGAKSAMPEVVGRLFVEEAFKQGAKEDVLDLVDNLRAAFKDMITDLPWMSDPTKVIARDKADYVEPRIGYPDLVYNNSALDEKWQSVEIFADDPLKSAVNFGKAGVKRQLENLRKPYDRTKWGMSAATVNAYYSPTNNQISFPAAILQPPFYAKDQPAYLNFGGIGYVIGHEITHGFDDRGRLFDKHGNLDSWWTDEDAVKFKERAQCIINQYGNFSVPGTGGMKLNGITTLGENIADNGGIKESFKAYRKKIAAQGKEDPKLPGLDYTPNQLYFLNAAQVWCTNFRDEAKIQRIFSDPHSLAPYRVYGPMQNFDEFSKAWNCPAGSFMNSAHKCSVW